MKFFPFDSRIIGHDEDGTPIYDRAVTSEIIRNVFNQYFTTGVFPNPSTGFLVAAGGGMQVEVNPGSCNVLGATAYEDEKRSLLVQAAEKNDRIDTVVLRLNLNVEGRNIDLYVLKGTAEASPKPPVLQRDSSIYEIGIANLYISKNSSVITQERITDTRLHSSRCGYSLPLQKIDTDALYRQIQADLSNFQTISEADFLKWFEEMKGQLTEDAAGSLLQKITTHEESKTNPHATTKAQVGLSNVDNTADVNKPVSTAQQSAINTVSNALSTHKGSGDHDGRYYTETEMNTKLAAKQDTSTAINTSNIGNQSVNYANSAGSATNATNAGNVGGYDANNLLRRNGGTLDNGQLTITGSGRLYVPGAFCSNGLAQGVMVCGDKIWGLGDGASYMSVMANSGSWALTWFASDSRLKKNIANTAIKALDMIGKIRHRTFDWKDGKRESVKVGYVAQELEEIGMDVTFKVPQQEGAEYEELYQIDPTRLLPYITKAIQEQQIQIEELTREIAELKSQGAI